jgi:patatin-related protein
MDSFEVNQEIHFAVVMYGGVSLAVYMNGVTQELLHMVKSTTDDLTSSLSGTEKIYRKIAKKLEARLVIDILTGTSAGGINAVFLAKALANAQSIQHLEKLWLEEGDIDVLINDKRSLIDGLKANFASPRSLLNSSRMYRKLSKALNDMDDDPLARQARMNSQTTTPYHDEIDLFVTATDLQGCRTPLRLSDKVVYELRHKNIFHFSYNKKEEINDFTKENNPFLAFAARCTSSFPFAFEPMVLNDVVEYKLNPDWSKFYQKYLIDQSVADSTTQQLHANAPLIEIKDQKKYDTFTKRAFADGGYLDNKPFTYAIEAISSRSCDVPVNRKLIYIEPAPQPTADELTVADPPDAIENVIKAFGLPRYETIREDLQQIKERNRLIGRIAGILEGTLDDIQNKLGEKKPVNVKDWLETDPDKMIFEEGIAYGGYQRLRVLSLTDDLAEIITRQAGFETESDFFVAVSYLVCAWRDFHYTYSSAKGDKRKNSNQFLFDFNLIFFDRRLKFTISNLDRMYRKLRSTKEGRKAKQKESEEPCTPNDVVDHVILEECQDSFREKLRKIRLELSSRLEEISKLRQILYRAKPYSKLTKAVRSIDLNPKQVISDILQQPTKDDAKTKAENIVKSKMKEFEKVALIIKSLVKRADVHSDMCKLSLGLAEFAEDHLRRSSIVLKKEVESYLKNADQDLDTDIKFESKPWKDWPNDEKLGFDKASWAADMAIWAVSYYFKRFPHYDMVSFPIQYASNAGEELALVDILRISPEDATSLSSAGQRKLGGSTLAHFGAFFDLTWRKNDILWGRLDGAERIITALLARTPYAAETKKMVKKAHKCIIEETFLKYPSDSSPASSQKRLHEGMDLLTAALSGKTQKERDANRANMSKLVESQEELKSMLKGVLEGNIDSLKIYRLFKNYEVNRDLEPKKVLRPVARMTQVVGRILDGISQERRLGNFGHRSANLFIKIGRLLWGLVEVATPHSIYSLVFKYWLKLAFLISLIMFFIGPLFSGGEAIRKFGLSLLLIVGAIYFVRLVMKNILLKRFSFLRHMVNLFAILASAAIIFLVGFGLFHLLEVWQNFHLQGIWQNFKEWMLR